MPEMTMTNPEAAIVPLDQRIKHYIVEVDLICVPHGKWDEPDVWVSGLVEWWVFDGDVTHVLGAVYDENDIEIEEPTYHMRERVREAAFNKAQHLGSDDIDPPWWTSNHVWLLNGRWTDD